MKIAILTMFNDLSPTYSLVNIVKEQLEMFLCDQVEVKMLVSEHCPDQNRIGIFNDPRIEWIKVVNSMNHIPFHWVTYCDKNKIIEPSFFNEAACISKDYVRYLKDVDYCILHDILYQGIHLLHNVALRNAQKQLPNVHFLAFTHSMPNEYQSFDYPLNCLYQAMENTTFIYPTKCGLEALARQYNTTLPHCAFVHNSVPLFSGMNKEINQISKFIDFSKSELLIIYPGRFNTSKKFHLVAQFAGTFKKVFQKSVSIVFCDFPSADIEVSLYKFMIRDLASKSGLEKSDILFTSDCGFPYGVKRETIFDLFSISNLFICPSFAESFGLTVMEAAARGNYIVLNEAVPALKEVGLALHAHFMRWSAKNFGFDTYETYLPNESLYYNQHALKIIMEMKENPVIHAKTIARTRYSSKWIYEHQLKPLLKK
ncbi:MAG: glycosyltransferase [Erysipelotrichaceae bacterium]